MKTQIIEPDFIGGQGEITKEEELALSQYFSMKKEKKKNRIKSAKLSHQPNTRL